jgi:hypothetical protein
MKRFSKGGFTLTGNHKNDKQNADEIEYLTKVKYHPCLFLREK